MNKGLAYLVLVFGISLTGFVAGYCLMYGGIIEILNSIVITDNVIDATSYCVFLGSMKMLLAPFAFTFLGTTTIGMYSKLAGEEISE